MALEPSSDAVYEAAHVEEGVAEVGGGEDEGLGFCREEAVDAEFRG